MELKSRLDLALTGKTRPTLEKHGWLTQGESPKWHFQVWDSTTEEMKIDSAREPVAHNLCVASYYKP